MQTGMMGPVNGKDTFQIKVTNRSDGPDVTWSFNYAGADDVYAWYL